MDCRGVTPCALTPRAKDLAARSNAQDPSGGALCFAAQLREHRIEHLPIDLIVALGIVQCYFNFVGVQLDQHPDRGIGAGRFSRFR